MHRATQRKSQRRLAGTAVGEVKPQLAARHGSLWPHKVNNNTMSSWNYLSLNPCTYVYRTHVHAVVLVEMLCDLMIMISLAWPTNKH